MKEKEMRMSIESAEEWWAQDGAIKGNDSSKRVLNALKDILENGMRKELGVRA